MSAAFNIFSLVPWEVIPYEEYRKDAEENIEIKRSQLVALLGIHYDFLKEQNIPTEASGVPALRRYVASLSVREVVKMTYIINTLTKQIAAETDNVSE